MDRLVAFGCSNTFGQALPDCDVKFNQNQVLTLPSRLAWPNKLAEMLNMEVHNAAIPGASNKQIMNQITTFPFRSTDTCVVMWSYSDRYTILDQPRNKYHNFQEINYSNQFLPQMVDTNKKIKNYYRYIYSRSDHLIMTAHYISYCRLYLESQNLPNFHTACEDISHPVVFSIEHAKIRGTFPKALDGSHPGEKAHMECARRIYKRMTS